MTSSLRGADIVARSLKRLGCTRVFTLSGNHIMSIFDAALDAGLDLVHVRHVDGGGLVADMDKIEAGIEGGVEDRHDVVAGQREDAARAEPAERLGDNVGASQRGHVALSVAGNLEGASTGCQRPMPRA
jgi:hypothetical protein